MNNCAIFNKTNTIINTKYTAIIKVDNINLTVYLAFVCVYRCKNILVKSSFNYNRCCNCSVYSHCNVNDCGNIKQNRDFIAT